MANEKWVALAAFLGEKYAFGIMLAKGEVPTMMHIIRDDKAIIIPLHDGISSAMLRRLVALAGIAHDAEAIAFIAEASFVETETNDIAELGGFAPKDHPMQMDGLVVSVDYRAADGKVGRIDRLWRVGRLEGGTPHKLTSVPDDVSRTWLDPKNLMARSRPTPNNRITARKMYEEAAEGPLPEFPIG